MIVYSGLKSGFLEAVEQDWIAAEIEENIYNKMHRCSALSEFCSWENPLEHMYEADLQRKYSWNTWSKLWEILMN